MLTGTWFFSDSTFWRFWKSLKTHFMLWKDHFWRYILNIFGICFWHKNGTYGMIKILKLLIVIMLCQKRTFFTLCTFNNVKLIVKFNLRFQCPICRWFMTSQWLNVQGNSLIVRIVLIFYHKAYEAMFILLCFIFLILFICLQYDYIQTCIYIHWQPLNVQNMLKIDHI